MDEFLPGHVYKNLIKMLEYRNVAPTGQALEPDEVIRRLNHYEFVTIQGRRPPDDPRGEATVIIILIAPKSKYATKSADFKKLLKGLPKLKPDEVCEVMFVSEEPLTIHIRKHLVSYRAENPKILLEDYSYLPFLIEAPLHESVPPHRLATDAEVSEFCDLHFTSREYFPKILQSDVQAVWLGARPGMVVRVDRVSETAGKAVAYRYCVK